MSFTQKRGSLRIPRLSTLSVSLLHSQPSGGTEPPNIGVNRGVEKTGKQPTKSQAPIKRGSQTRQAIDAFFANTAGSAFCAKFDVFYLTAALQMSPILSVLQEKDREIIRHLT